MARQPAEPNALKTQQFLDAAILSSFQARAALTIAAVHLNPMRNIKSIGCEPLPASHFRH
jgi:hypothetical protein